MVAYGTQPRRTSHRRPENSDLTVETTAILINELVETVHKRMPVILQTKYYDDWLSRDVQDVETLEAMLQPYPAREMEADPASSNVNNARNAGPECLAASG